MFDMKSFCISVCVGVLLAGPLASLVVVALPERWRSPLVPWAVAALTVALIVAVRRPKRPAA
jgi:hypothetical protein